MTFVGRSAREQAEFDRVHYPGIDILRNKLGLRNRADLELAERYLWAKRASQGLPPAALRLDVKGLRALHHHHLQDVYEWAGTFRTYTTGRGAAPFATPENIGPWLEQQFTALREERYLKDLNTKRFADGAAYFVNEINAAHPFIEGNGRVQRVWLRILADYAGLTLKLRSEDRERWNEASRIGFEASDPAPMAELIRGSLTHR